MGPGSDNGHSSLTQTVATREALCLDGKGLPSTHLFSPPEPHLGSGSARGWCSFPRHSLVAEASGLRALDSQGFLLWVLLST